jgi:hypothetical protein
MVIDKTEPEAEQDGSSPFSPLSASLPSVDVKPQTNGGVSPPVIHQPISQVAPQVNPQVVVTTDTQDIVMHENASVISPEFTRPDGLAANQDFVRAVSVSSTGSSSIMRQSPTPVPMPTEPEREIILRESEKFNFPSPPPSDDEFELPTRQPFKQSAGDVAIRQRHPVKTIGSKAPDMEWTRLLPETQPTPPDSPAASSTGSDDMEMDSMDDGDALQDVDMQEADQRQPPAASVNTNSASPTPGSKRSADEARSAQGKQNGVSKSAREKESSSKKKASSKDAGEKSGKKKEQSGSKTVPREWELRAFVAPGEDELKEFTSPKGSSDSIPFKDIRQLLPPVITGADRGKLQASFDQLRKLLFPEGGNAPVDLYLNQLVWVVNQMAVAGSREYFSALAKPHNLRLLESILLHAYQKQKGVTDPQDKKANITKWRSVKAAYFTIQVSPVSWKSGKRTDMSCLSAALAQAQSQ